MLPLKLQQVIKVPVQYIHKKHLASVRGGEGDSNNKFLKIGSNATAKDWIVPTASSAGIFKDNPKQVRILMSEAVGNVNSTLAEFTMTTSGGGNDAVPALLTFLPMVPLTITFTLLYKILLQLAMF